jgi:class 3 adenylate cyclase
MRPARHGRFGSTAPLSIRSFASHGGRIVKITADGVLLEFRSIVAAVECAVAVRKLMANPRKKNEGAKRGGDTVGRNSAAA